MTASHVVFPLNLLKKVSYTGKPLVFVSIVLLLVVSLLVFFTASKIEREYKVSIADSLTTILHITEESIYSLITQRKNAIEDVASHVELVLLTQQIIDENDNYSGESYKSKLAQFRHLINPVLLKNHDPGFFVIAKSRVTMASLVDDNIGTVNVISEARDKYISRVFKGETVFVPPIISDRPLKNFSGHLIDGLATMFVMAPIKNADNQIIAALAFRMDPARDFSRITQLGRIGKSGETYAFDENGLLLTVSRFEKTLELLGMISAQHGSMLALRVTDPGGDLLSGYHPKIKPAKQALTLMAASATRGGQGVNTEGYRDYRGVTVFGSWMWIESLGIGFTTEIDAAEAMGSFYNARRMVVGMVIVMLLITISLYLILQKTQKKVEEQLLIARVELERQVTLRTEELMLAKKDLEVSHIQLEKMVETDSLTGIANRRCFDRRLVEEWRRCQRDKKPLSLVMIDVDNFKNYNDIYGHIKGDECLKRLATAFTESGLAMRPGDLIARYGGEEFSIILSGSSIEQTKQSIDLLIKKVCDEGVEHKGSEITQKCVTISAGVACETEFHSSDPVNLIERADAALYESKTKGRNQSSISIMAAV